jgi:ComF family protein
VRLAQLFRDVTEFLYPGLCASCRKPSGNSFLCEICSGEVDHLAITPACPLCALPLGYPNAPCPYCIGRGVSHYDRIVRLTPYDPPIRGLVHRLKYNRSWAVGEFFADRLLAMEAVKSLLQECDCVVPIPLHFLRRWGRGYNQAEVIARRLARACDLPLASPVVRQRNTEAQTHLHSRQRRMANLRGAFRLTDPAEIAGRHVVVVDDVLTTGATLQMLARTLKPAKPASLSALVVAVAEPKPTNPRPPR